MRINILFGGPAGTGPNILTHILGEALVKQGYYVFYSRDYESLIRGGHNFNVLTFSDKKINSNDYKIDILVALDENTLELHKNQTTDKTIILQGKHPNMYFAGKVFKLLCMDFKILEQKLKNLEKRFEENLREAKQGYEEESQTACKIHGKNSSNLFMNGTQGISNGAIKSGLDVYYAYPMTPATPLLSELASNQIQDNILVLELENEIAVINAAIGTSMTGAKSMIGTSGGGFDLMTEALSLTGIAEIPLVVFLSQRPGPGTGVATYTAQGDLNIALKAGHGEFQRTVFAPGDPIESEELTNQAFYFSQKYKIPSIILSDKHLGESFYTIEEKSKIVKSEKSVSLIRFNSYETDETGSATENAEIIKRNILERQKKVSSIKKDSKNFTTYKIHGNKNSKNLIVSWGSTKGAILDSIKDLDFKFIQFLYLDPFPEEIIKELEKTNNVFLIENNSTGLLGNLIREKTGFLISDKNKILRFDGRPFLHDELKQELEKRLRE